MIIKAGRVSSERKEGMIIFSALTQLAIGALKQGQKRRSSVRCAGWSLRLGRMFGCCHAPICTTRTALDSGCTLARYRSVSSQHSLECTYIC